MLLKRFKITPIVFLAVCCAVIQFEAAAAYKSEIAITPAPPEEETTKKSGFFSGVKSWFRGGDTTTTTTPLPVLAATTQNIPQTVAGTNYAAGSQQTTASGGPQRPPPLSLGPAPMVPLGPRPDTPSTSPWGGGGNPRQPPQWPEPQNPQGGNAQPQFPHPAAGGSATAGGNYMPGGAHIPGGAIMPGGSSTTIKPTQPQSPHNVPGNLPRPAAGSPSNVPSQGGGQFNFPSSTSSTQSNLPQPGSSQPTSSTVQGNQHNLPRPGVSPNFPTSQSSTNQNIRPGQANMPGFGPYQPPKTQPSGFDLSYGGGSGGGFSRPSQPAGRPGFGPAPAGTSTTVIPGRGTPTPTAISTGPTTSTTTPKVPQMDFDLRLGQTDPKKPSTPTKEDYPALPAPRRPSTGGVKEDFPSLPVPKSPVPTPSSPVSPSSPSAWNKPLPTPASVGPAATPTTAKTPTPHSPAAPAGGAAGGSGVSFVPHTGGRTTPRTPLPSSSDGNALATDAEIQTLTETLYTKETNSQLSLITVSPQGKTRSIDSTDEAPKPLLDVNSKVLESPTVAKMQVLFNNYEQDTLTNEHVTPNERKEENDFVDAVMATNVMRQAMLFLQNKGIVGPDPKTHRDMVKELWFTQYSRGSGKIGSSGFEHVFVNEVKNGTIIGLHNWLYFADEEKAGRLDYKGYLNQLDMGTKAKIMKVRFTHNGLNKPVNTLFVGTSPELELALYTVCFKLRPDRTCPVSLGNSKFGVVTYSWRYRGKSLIGSAYPEI
uniref:EndoU domain-containing protein n=1 Tax=Stomoxys calcitrans TaxID=35570 RepID=A0A1I8PMU6_STOCA|nr:unnamed protein product [Stomoxys calcitrans]